MLVSCFLVSCLTKTPEQTAHEGKELPSFQLLLQDSTTILDTKNIVSGRPIVIFLFGPNCPYCRAQMKNIIDNAKKLSHIQFYAITFFPYEEMKKFNQEFELKKYKNIITGVDILDFYRSYMRAVGVPYIAIYDKDKKLKKAFSGKTDISLIKTIAEQN